MGHELLQREGWAVAGTTRDPDKRDTLLKRGVEAHLFDYERPLPDPQTVLAGTTHLLLSVPPGDQGDTVFNAHAKDLLNIPTLEWAGYLSTTGVYGDREGEGVDEGSGLSLCSQRGSRRVQAEED